MITLNRATPVPTRVQHLATGDYGWFLGLDDSGLAEVSFDDDYDSRTSRFEPSALIVVAS